MPDRDSPPGTTPPRRAPERHGAVAERMLARLKLRQLRLIVEIERCGSILGAARALSVSQPAATKLVKDLELDLGVALFRRTNRGVVPTPAGVVIARHGRRVVAQVERAAHEVGDLAEGRGGKVVVGTLLAASARLLPLALARLAAERPGVRVTVRDGTNDLLMPLLERGELDLVVGRLPEYRHRRGLTQERLATDRLVVAARPGHPLAAAAEPVPLAELAAYAFVLQPHETTVRRQIERRFADGGVDPPVAIVESVSFLLMRELLIGTDMLAILPADAVGRDVASGTLALVPCGTAFPAAPVGVSYRQGDAPSPAAATLLGALRAVAGESAKE